MIFKKGQPTTANKSKLGINDLFKVYTSITNISSLKSKWLGNPSLLILVNRWGQLA